MIEARARFFFATIESKTTKNERLRVCFRMFKRRWRTEKHSIQIHRHPAFSRPAYSRAAKSGPSECNQAKSTLSGGLGAQVKSGTIVPVPPRPDLTPCTPAIKLASLHSLDPFYTPLEERFERITRLARRALDVPIAAITIVEDDRQWFKSVAGLHVTELPMSKSLCSEVLKEARLMLVPDTLSDLYLMSNPLVCGKPGIRFYAGVPLKDSGSTVIGTFCAMDVKPRQTDENFATILADLGDIAQRELLSMEIVNAQAALVSKLGKARRQAMFDPLTRLWNRRGGTQLLTSAMRDAVRYDHTLGVCVADIDNFKQINDQFGHQVGDHVLRRVAGAIVQSVRPQDIVCRYGGEEFLVIVHDVDEAGSAAIGERICAGMRELELTSGGATFSATVSVGVALRGRGDGVSAERLVALADKALYESKRAGRDRVTVGRDR